MHPTHANQPSAIQALATWMYESGIMTSFVSSTVQGFGLASQHLCHGIQPFQAHIIMVGGAVVDFRLPLSVQKPAHVLPTPEAPGH